MKVVFSPKGILGIKRPGQGCTDMKRAGMTHAMLCFSMACQPYELEKTENGSTCGIKEKIVPVIERCKAEEIKLSVAYAPFLSRDTKRTDLNEKMQSLVQECLEICGIEKIEYLVVRPLFAGIEGNQLWEENRKFYFSLAQKAKERKVKILLENQCKNVNGHMVRGVCADPVQASEWIDALNAEAGFECFGFCLNVGAANMCGQNMYEMAKVLGRRLKAVILADSDGHKETAFLTFTCVQNGRSQTDWLGVIRGLRELKFDGELIIDFSDTAESFSPILRPQLLQLAKATGDYFAWQIQLEKVIDQYPQRVLFGAGNMCRNYMKCYGEKYPPLFTCDNNSRLWGTEFEGLTVKNPIELKNIPEDCVIFICNVYYREIEAQLRDMGITNPIEFFNDEYMPSFYYDRI